MLAGWITALWGIWDLWRYDRAADTLRAALPAFNTGFWSRHDLDGRIASPARHALHVAQLGVTAALLDDEVIARHAQAFSGHAKSPLCWARAAGRGLRERVGR